MEATDPAMMPVPHTPFYQTDPDSLSRRRKAAIVVQTLLAEGQKPPLAKLPEDAQIELTREMGSLRLVDRETLNAVITEFANDLAAVGLTPPRGIDGALAALTGHISPAAAARLKAEASMTDGVDPWIPVMALSAADIVPILTTESIEVCAVVLSKLPVAKAAEVLGLLPGERARRITYAVSQTKGISPQAVKRIGRAVATDYCNKPIPAFDAPPDERVGAILNSSVQITRDQVLEGLEVEDKDFAEQVRKSIFTFPLIPARLRPADVPRVLRVVEQPTIVTALAAAMAAGGEEAGAAEFILANMSQRMADALREEMGERGKVKKADGEAAQSALITAIRERAEIGEISLIQPDDEAE